MDQSQTDEDSLEPRQIDDVKVNDAVTTRKVLKADREKLRRDKLNEQFQELGNVLDPERPKNDKASILTDTIQVLKDLNSEVTKLKEEHTALCEESHELTQEKNELRQEKVSLKSDIHDLKTHLNQNRRSMVPWMAQAYPFPVGLPILANHHPAGFIPYLAPVIHQLDRPTTLHPSTSYISGPENSNSAERSSCSKIIDNSNDVATDLELKVPGSTVQELPQRERGKQVITLQGETKSATNGSSSSKFSSQDSRGSSFDSVNNV